MVDEQVRERQRRLGEPFDQGAVDLVKQKDSLWVLYADRLDDEFGYQRWETDFERCPGVYYFQCKLTISGKYKRVGMGKTPDEAFIHACEQFGIGRDRHIIPPDA